MKFSIIIPTLSEGSTIASCLLPLQALRSNCEIIIVDATGDQVIFATKQALAAVGHYPEIALLEDVALSKALKKISPPVCVNAKVTSSGRRWERYGLYRTILLMWSLRLHYFFDADPQLLAALYFRGQFWKP